MANQGGSGPGLAPPVPAPQDQQQPQHNLQPAASTAPGPLQPAQSSYGGYQHGAAVNGMCSWL